MTDKEFLKVCTMELEGMLYGTAPASNADVITKLTGLDNNDTMVQLIARAVAEKRKMQIVS